ncbi:unnamed protein product, partial [marine sediment metagenome]
YQKNIDILDLTVSQKLCNLKIREEVKKWITMN